MNALLLAALALAAAKPPEPLEEIFPLTALIVEAEVKELRADHVIVLNVTNVVRGALSAEQQEALTKKTLTLVVSKPKASAYTLRVGVKGPWLLARAEKTGELSVLGRYGPDTWPLEKITAKLKELDPPQLRAPGPTP